MLITDNLWFIMTSSLQFINVNNRQSVVKMTLSPYAITVIKQSLGESYSLKFKAFFKNSLLKKYNQKYREDIGHSSIVSCCKCLLLSP